MLTKLNYLSTDNVETNIFSVRDAITIANTTLTNQTKTYKISTSRSSLVCLIQSGLLHDAKCVAKCLPYSQSLQTVCTTLISD